MRLPVTLTLRSSRRLAAALVAAHAGVAAGMLAGTIALAANVAAGLVLAFSLLLSLRKILRPPFAALRLLADGRLEGLRADGSATPLRVLSDTTVLAWLVVLRLRGDDGSLALVLPRDAVVDGHRALRLWLRWKASAA